MLVDYSTYQCFDNFNDKYSPFHLGQMRKIFLKMDNHIDGRCVRVVHCVITSRCDLVVTN